jgi:hypothetical protein
MMGEERDAATERDRASAREGQKQGIPAGFIIGVAAVAVIAILIGFYFIKRYMEGSLTEELPGLRRADTGLATAQGRPVLRDEVRIFATSNGKFLTPFVLDLPRKMNSAERADFILRKLLEGPPADYLASPVPQGTKLRGFYMLGNLAVVDFSKELRENLVGGLSAEQLCVYSIVNSLVLNCEDIKAVRILIEGQKVATLLGNIDLESPLVEDLALIRW